VFPKLEIERYPGEPSPWRWATAYPAPRRCSPDPIRAVEQHDAHRAAVRHSIRISRRRSRASGSASSELGSGTRQDL